MSNLVLMRPWSVRNQESGEIVNVSACSASFAVLEAALLYSKFSDAEWWEVSHNLKSVTYGPWFAWRNPDTHFVIAVQVEEEKMYA